MRRLKFARISNRNHIISMFPSADFYEVMCGHRSEQKINIKNKPDDRVTFCGDCVKELLRKYDRLLTQNDVRQLMSNSLDYLFRSFIPKSGHSIFKTTIEKNSNGGYNFIPMSNYEVVKTFLLLEEQLFKQKKREVKFLDVGCGVGNVMLLFLNTMQNKFNVKCHGVEIDKYNVEMAQKILDVNKDDEQTKLFDDIKKIKIFHEDALSFNKYSEYDVIYFYRPFYDVKKQKELENLIESNLKSGSFYIPIMKQDMSSVNKNLFLHYYSNNSETIYQKK